MRNVVKSRARWLQAGWVLPFALLALPNCMLNSEGLGGSPSPTFAPGEDNLSSAIMCDIKKVPNPSDDGCATLEDMETGVSLTAAAIKLAQGQGTLQSLGLDFSQIGNCGGKPKKVEFHGPFPAGLRVCLNCETQLTEVYPDPTAACVAKCVDLVKGGEFQPAEGAQTYCESNAKVSTNFVDACYGGACTSGGSPNMAWEDPRRLQELVKWDTVQGQYEVTGNTLKKFIENDGDPMNWDTGGASSMIIERGDAWVEFGAGENGVSHVLGVSSGADDADGGLADIGFAISLNYDDSVYILENGASYISQPLMTYLPTDRFRVRITDNTDNTASIRYTKLDGLCTEGTECAEIELGTQTLASPSYPLRITATFREANASLTNVKVVRIQNP